MCTNYYVGKLELSLLSLEPIHN
uniref:Uncharacterized protein n=1 Tax=Rhizophora mucronata TaxID=61149 RepID=A0A2P2ILR8_RHIMU